MAFMSERVSQFQGESREGPPQTACASTQFEPPDQQNAIPPAQNQAETPRPGTVNGQSAKTGFAAQYREIVRRRVVGLCAVPNCSERATRQVWCAEHAETLLGSVKVKPKQLKQGVFRLR